MMPKHDVHAEGRMFGVRSLLKHIFMTILVGSNLCFSVNALAESQALSVWPVIQTTKPVKKLFTDVTHYRYWEMTYKPSPIVQPLQKEPKSYHSPEEVLISQISARKTLNFDWWLNTWDSASRSKILERAKATGKTEKFWLQQWKKKFVPAEVRLIRWVLKGQYVIVTYRLILPESNLPSADIREIPMAFGLFDGLWRATLVLEDNPIFLFSNREETQKGKIHVERTIRE